MQDIDAFLYYYCYDFVDNNFSIIMYCIIILNIIIVVLGACLRVMKIRMKRVALLNANRNYIVHMYNILQYNSTTIIIILFLTITTLLLYYY